jgi:hypothetical protein
MARKHQKCVLGHEFHLKSQTLDILLTHHSTDDPFTKFTTDSSMAPFAQWEVIKVKPNEGTGEKQWYETKADLTYIKSYPPSQPGGGGSTPGKDQLFITPQKRSDGKWESARFEGKKAYACPEGKSLILSAKLQTGNAPSDRQGGVWPAFWALGGSRKTGTLWPFCGEWDIFEASDGHDWSLASLHWGEKLSDGSETKQSRPTKDWSERMNKFDVSQPHTWALKVDRRPSNWQDQTIQCTSELYISSISPLGLYGPVNESLH